MNSKSSKKSTKGNVTLNYHKLMKAKLSSPPVRFHPYRKYDATVLKLKKGSADLQPVDITISKKPFLNINVTKDNIYLSPDTSSSSKGIETIKPSITEENESTTEGDYFQDIFSGIKNNIRKMSPQIMKVSYNLECFNLHSNEIFRIFRPLTHQQVEDMKKSYDSCFKLLKYSFEGVAPLITSQCYGKFVHYLEEMEDYRSNLSNLSEVELSIIRDICCGCKPLSWDDFEKNSLIKGKEQPPLQECSGNESNNHHGSASWLQSGKNKTLVIRNSRIYHHDSEDNLAVNNLKDSKNIYKSKKKNKKKKDPLSIHEIESQMVDSDDLNYIVMDEENSDVSVIENEIMEEIPEVPQESIKILANDIEEIESLRERMKNNQIKEISKDVLSETGMSNFRAPRDTSNSLSKGNSSSVSSSGVPFLTDNPGGSYNESSDLLSSIISKELGISSSSASLCIEVTESFDICKRSENVDTNQPNQDGQVEPSSSLKVTEDLGNRNSPRDLSTFSLHATTLEGNLTNSTDTSPANPLSLDTAIFNSVLGKIITNREMVSLLNSTQTRCSNSTSMTDLVEGSSSTGTIGVRQNQTSKSNVKLLMDLLPESVKQVPIPGDCSDYEEIRTNIYTYLSNLAKKSEGS